MPDDRMFHKRAGHSEKVNSLTDFEELVWRYYIESADDFGVMRFEAVALQADHDRAARKPSKTVQKALEHIRDAKLIHTFTHQGRAYCYQHDWQEWQKIDYPRSTIHPAPPFDELSAKTRDLFGKHPGGWGRKGPQPLGDGSTNVSQTSAEGSPTPSGESTREPLALAVSLSPSLSRESRPSRGIGSGVMAGTLPRDHLRHAWCGRICVPDFLHGQFVSGLGTDNADKELRAFYAETMADVTGPIGEDSLKFWRARVAARWPAPGASESALTSALRRANEGFLKS